MMMVLFQLIMSVTSLVQQQLKLTNESESVNQNCSDHSSKTISVDVPYDVSSGTFETVSQDDQETSLKNEFASEPFFNTSDSCVAETPSHMNLKLNLNSNRKRWLHQKKESQNDFSESEVKDESSSSSSKK
ncbi:hypothetical protein Hanom_Chr07g00641221 [Helianthus anomalus]